MIWARAAREEVFRQPQIPTAPDRIPERRRLPIALPKRFGIDVEAGVEQHPGRPYGIRDTRPTLGEIEAAAEVQEIPASLVAHAQEILSSSQRGTHRLPIEAPGRRKQFRLRNPLGRLHRLAAPATRRAELLSLVAAVIASIALEESGTAMSKEPTDLRKALAAAPAVQAIWNGLTPIARRDFISWIQAPKQPATRARRVQIACDKLLKGQRRPCCYSIVPLDLHLALKAAPKAKSRWHGLTPDGKRDLIARIESAKDRDVRRVRVEQACAALSSGKPRG